MTPSVYVARARQYEDAVLAGQVPACKWVRLACARNRRDLSRAAAGDPAFPYHFDDAAAGKVCTAIEHLPHVDGPKAKVLRTDDEGHPVWACIELEPWQCWFVTTLFGWLRVNRTRRFRTSLLLVPRKNAKSTLSAAIALYMLTADGESGPKVYSAATSRDQAKVVADITWLMARRSPEFREYYGVRVGSETTKTLRVPSRNGFFGPLSSDAHTLDGLNISAAIIDELHAHQSRMVWDVIDTATGARPQPLLFAITTAGFNIGGICYEQLGYLRKVLARALEDESYFGVEYTIDEGDDWKSETAWRKANPNMGVSFEADYLARKVRQAQHSPAQLNNFLTKHLNVWVSGTANWLPMDKWHACADGSLTLEQLRPHPCWIGVDLAEIRDVAAVVQVFQMPDGRYVVRGRYYLPEDTVDASPTAAYPGWVSSGHLVATDGGATDYQRIEDDIAALCDEFDVREVAFDRALAQQMGQHLMTRLGDAVPVITVPQTTEVMNPAMQWLEELIIKRRLVHDGDPVLTWMASNVVCFRNHKGEIYPRKAGGKDSHNKIDGIVALLTAAARIKGQTVQAESAYAGGGLLVV